MANVYKRIVIQNPVRKVLIELMVPALFTAEQTNALIQAVMAGQIDREKRLYEMVSLPDNDLEECPVCYEPFVAERLPAKLAGCDHIFCIDCIHKWINGKQGLSCPMCRNNT